MAKVTVAAKTGAAAMLTMELFAPGMTLLHRAGLGGLACTLRSIEKAWANDDLSDRDVPRGPWRDGKPPWRVTPTSIVLDFGVPDGAREFLRRLFTLSFATTAEGLIMLRGQHGYRRAPVTSVLAELQQGLLLTFLQHNRARGLENASSLVKAEIDGQPIPSVQYRKCSWYKHQHGWKALASTGKLTSRALEVAGPLGPGTVVRHVAFAAATRIVEAPTQVIPLYFAIVGCLSLAATRSMGVLLVPEVTDLTTFAAIRPLMTPTIARDCRVTSAGDAALQTQLRVRAKAQMARYADIPGIYAMTFGGRPWVKEQKCRVATIHVPPGDEARLARFETALAALPPRVRSYVRRETIGRGKQEKVAETTESFWADSVARQLVADNLAGDRPWYAGFQRLMTAIDRNGRPVRERLEFEGRGLHQMIRVQKMFETDGEVLVVRAVHEAIRHSFGRIREDTDGRNAGIPSQATKNRWERFRERLRINLAGAKTEAQVRFALADLFSRGGTNAVLRDRWTDVLSVLRSDWTLARDLGLLALASYTGKTNEEPIGGRK